MTAVADNGEATGEGPDIVSEVSDSILTIQAAADSVVVYTDTRHDPQ